LKHRYLKLVQAAFLESQKAENEFACWIDPFKHRFLDLAYFAFWISQKADNPFEGCDETISHRFIDFNQVLNVGGQKQEISS
jgi:hypothetical protein